jgi:hypothetical protein
MASRATKALALVAAAIGAVSVLGLSTAEATRIVRIPSHISIKSNGLTFSGKVTSPNAACVPARRVTLYRTNGNRLGSTRTGASGRWKITARGSAGISLGHFYARVTARSEGTAGTIYTCEPARSKTIPFHQ